MSFEREQDVDVRFSTWLRWMGGGLSVVAGIIATAISGNVGTGLMTAIFAQASQSMVSSIGGRPSGRRRVLIEPGTMTIDQLKVIDPSSRLAFPETRKGPDATVLRLRTRLRTIDITVSGDDEANAIRDAIAPDTLRATFLLWRTPLPNWTELGFLLVIPLLFVFAASIVWPASVVPLVIALSCLVFAAAAVRVLRAQVVAVVGADGVLLRQELRPSQFVRHGRLRSVRADGQQVVMNVDGDEVRLAVTLNAAPDQADVDHAKRIAERLEQARVAAAGRPAAPPETPGLLRGGRSTAEWLEALRKIGEGGETAFRDAAPPRDQLWQIIESADAPAAERIAAAIALRASGLSADESPRLRIAADGAVEPHLGERLRVASEGSDEALVNVLEAAHKEEEA